MTAKAEHQVYFVTAKHQELAEQLRDERGFTSLLGSDAYSNKDGTIAYTTWRDLPEALLSPKYVQVSWVHP